MQRNFRHKASLYPTAAALAILMLLSGPLVHNTFGGASTPRQEREQLMAYQEAVRLFRDEGKAKEAGEILRAFVRMHPESPYADNALLELSRTQVYLDNRRKAISTLRKMLHSFPASPLRKRAFMELGFMLSDEGKYRNSNEALESALSLNPLPEEKFQALTLKARNLLKMRNRIQAVLTAIKAYRTAETGIIRGKARQVIIETSLSLKDRELEKMLTETDGAEPMGVVAMTRVERAMENKRYQGAMRDLMDLLVDYPDQVSRDRIDSAFAELKGRLLVKSNTIGVILPLSGNYAVYGEKALQGILTAFGILSPLEDDNSELDIQIVVKDSGADPMKTSQAVRDLSESDQVLAIIGPLFSRTTRAAVQAAIESGTPLISLSADPTIPTMGKNIFSRSITDDQQIKALTELVHNRLSMNRFAFLYPDNSYGKELMNLFWDEIDRMGAIVVAAESFQPGQTDFGPQIRAMVGLDRPLTEDQKTLKEAGQKIELDPIVDFDALFVPADFQTVGLLAPQLAFYDVTEALLLGTNGWNSPWVVELGEHYVEGAIFTGSFYADTEDDDTRKFMQLYWLTFGEDPQPLAAQAYDAALIIRSALESGRVNSRISLIDFISKLSDFPAAEGTLTTDENGDITQVPYLLTINSGKIEKFRVEID